MPEAERFFYTATPGAEGDGFLRPILPFRLEYAGKTLSTSALVDSGASVSVLPYSAGLALGAEWDKQKISIPLGGALGQVNTRALVVSAIIGNFSPVNIIFAWAQIDTVPLILGQTNFFVEFDVCFFRSQSVFEVRPKSGGATA